MKTYDCKDCYWNKAGICEDAEEGSFCSTYASHAPEEREEPSPWTGDDA